MSGHCHGCGTYHEEDDDRLCAKCAADVIPATKRFPEPENDAIERNDEETEYRRNQERLSRLRWVVVSLEDGNEVAAFHGRELAIGWMNAIGHTRLRLVCRDTWK